MDDLNTLMASARQVIEVLDTSYSEFVPVKLTNKQRLFVETNDDERLEVQEARRMGLNIC